MEEENKMKIKRKRKPNSSPMQIMFWINKINPKTQQFYTEEEAKYHIRSFRKCNIEYWIERGYSIDDAKQKINDFQCKASQASIKERSNHPEWNSTHIEYWLAKGFNETEAICKLKERQRTFTLEKCIAKYGLMEGTKIFNNRQIKWQNTLKSKPISEIRRINKSKNRFNYFYSYKGKLDINYWNSWKNVCKKYNLTYIDNIEELKTYICDLCLCTKYICGKSIDWFLSKSCPKYLWKVMHLKQKTVKSWLSNLNIKFTQTYKVFNSKHNIMSYHQLLSNGKILRSLKEIAFYNLLIYHGILDIQVGNKYPYSNMVYDFYVNGFYIEIAGMIGNNSYKSKMIYKRNTFNSMILVSEKEYSKFIQKVLIEHDKKTINYFHTRPL